MKKDYSEEEYPFLVSKIMEHIEEVKTQDPESALIEIIYDFAFRNGIDVELVGDAISNDVYFKSFIEKDCELHRIFRSESTKMQDW